MTVMLIEREAELASIRGALDDAARGAGRALVFCGEPGIGKSALLSRAVATTEALVLTTRGTETESELPFAGLRDLLAPLLEAAPELPTPQRMALLGALAIEEVDHVELFGVFTGALTLMSIAAERQPLLICADDLQWLDAGSADTLRFVAGRIAREPITMLLAARERPAGLDAPEIETHELHGLSRQGAQELLAGRMESTAPLELVDELHRATGGNPLALVELGRNDVDVTLRAAAGLAPLPVCQAIRKSFARRLSALSVAARTALVVAATAQRDDMGLLVEAGSHVGASVDAFLEAEQAGAVVLQDGHLQFQHPLLRSVVYGESPAAERRRAHVALARAAGRLSRHDEEAWHRAGAAVMPDEEIALSLETAAAGYARRSGHIGAAQALELAAKLTPDPGRRAHRLQQASEEARRAGRVCWARALLDDAAALAESPAVIAQIEFTKTLLTAWSESTASAREGYEALADRLSETDRDGAATAYAYAAAQAVVEGRIETARRDAALARSLLEQHPLSTYATAVVRHADAIVRVLVGDPDGRQVTRAAAQDLLDTGQLSGREYVALPLIWIEEYGLARTLVDSRLAEARHSGDLRALTAALEVDATLRYRTGDWWGSRAAAAESARLARESQQRVQLAYSLATLSIVLAGQDHADALTTADEAEALAAEHGLAELEQYIAAARGLAELGRERAETALARLERAERYAATAAQREPAVHQWAADLVEAAVLLRQHGRAETVTMQLEAAALATSRPWAHAVVARARGMSAPDDGFSPHFEEALHWHDRTTAPFERARTHLWWGRRLRRSRRRVDARRQLETALGIFEQLGAGAWLGIARRELRATGATLRARDAMTRDELTPQEHQIAGLVVAGASNKDVAASMFLSPKTVETHLSRVYRKLGVRSRVDLIRLAALSDSD
jgi:DNA-binding CsgD family transcriptional regulator